MLFDPIGSDKKQLNTANKIGEHAAYVRALACSWSFKYCTPMYGLAEVHITKNWSAHPRVPHSDNNKDNGEKHHDKNANDITYIYLFLCSHSRETYKYACTAHTRIFDAQYCAFSISLSIFFSLFWLEMSNVGYALRATTYAYYDEYLAWNIHIDTQPHSSFIVYMPYMRYDTQGAPHTDALLTCSDEIKSSNRLRYQIKMSNMSGPSIERETHFYVQPPHNSIVALGFHTLISRFSLR